MQLLSTIRRVLPTVVATVAVVATGCSNEPETVRSDAAAPPTVLVAPDVADAVADIGPPMPLDPNNPPEGALDRSGSAGLTPDANPRVDPELAAALLDAAVEIDAVTSEMIVDGPLVAALLAPSAGDQSAQLQVLIADHLDGALVRMSDTGAAFTSVRVGAFDTAESAARADQLMVQAMDGMGGAELPGDGELRMFSSRTVSEGVPLDLTAVRVVTGRYLIEVAASGEDRVARAAELARAQADALR